MITRESQASDPIETARSLEVLLAGATDAVASELPAVDARAMARRAMARAASERRASRVRRAIWAGVSIAAAIGLGVVGSLSMLDEPVAPEAARETPPPSTGAARTELPSGDLVWAAADADYRVISASAERREIRVTHGEVLFDVRPLREGERFVVRTAHGEARVRGTVFSVLAAQDRTVVRVFEGHVEVERADGLVEHVRAGGASAFTAATRAAVAPGALDALGGERARLRTAAEPPAPVVERAPSAPEPTPEPAAHASVSPETARRWLVDGRYARALREARQHDGGEWRVIEGDAARALHDDRAAAAAYARAAVELPRPRSALAAVLGARIRFEQLHDPEGALELLERSGAAADRSPVLERALLLEARIHRATGDGERARAVAARYLARFPRGAGASELRELASEPSPR